MDMVNFGENQSLYEAEKTTIMEKLAEMDPASEEYSTVMRNLHMLDEVAENEMKARLTNEENEIKLQVANAEISHSDRRTRWQVIGSALGSLAGIGAILFGETIMERIFTSKAMSFVKKP